MMQRLSTRVSSRMVLSSMATLFGNAWCSSFLPKQSFSTSSLRGGLQKLQKQSIPGDSLKWGSLGFCRTSKFATGFTALQLKPLDSIIDIERAKTQSAEDLASIWDDVIYPATCRYFMPHMLFTGLEDYKARGTQAAPYFTVSYHTEFAESHDLVLARGDIVFTSKLSDIEAKWLLETMQSFYLNDVRYKLVERFNRETREFEFEDVLRMLDMPIL
ncbi:unnamed protein product [Camellia sinensis]